ncbi:exosome complex component RRP45-like [Notothenia coriiceps]|uniref:Exosome complex component RRP45-like n=1 Tax=Notothenia coriiceps TaxID=8208 RepID=A0A6I9PNG0_9TELE|nr:PREDICTED: exosome complex component RRP45-like [Notothenia coriiceps]
MNANVSPVLEELYPSSSRAVFFSTSCLLCRTYLLVDPCEREERVMDGLLMIAMNKHREICSIQSSGGIMLLKEQVMRCSKIASVKVSEITELISKALENDKRARKAGGRCGFAESMPQERITALKTDETSVEMTDASERANDIVENAEVPPQTVPSPVVPVPGVGQVGQGLQNTWGLEEEEEEEDGDEEEEEQKMEEEQDEKEDSREGYYTCLQISRFFGASRFFNADLGDLCNSWRTKEFSLWGGVRLTD